MAAETVNHFVILRRIRTPAKIRQILRGPKTRAQKVAVMDVLRHELDKRNQKYR
jgi:hypothetical protein